MKNALLGACEALPDGQSSPLGIGRGQQVGLVEALAQRLHAHVQPFALGGQALDGLVGGLHLQVELAVPDPAGPSGTWLWLPQDLVLRGPGPPAERNAKVEFGSVALLVRQVGVAADQGRRQQLNEQVNGVTLLLGLLLLLSTCQQSSPNPPP